MDFVRPGFACLSLMLLLGPPQPEPELAVSGEASRPQLPLTFMENRGQWESPARFLVESGPLLARLEPGRVALDLRAPGTSCGHLVYLTFEGANPGASIEGEAERSTRHSYFVGARSRWRGDVPSYASVVYRDLYEGISVRFRQEGGRIEYDLLLSPGADLERFVVSCEGIEALEVDGEGNLVLQTAAGEVRQSAPRSWEVFEDGSERRLDCRFRPLGDRRFGFIAPTRDPGLAAVVDPGIEWSTFVGGPLDDGERLDLFREPSGDILVTGETESSSFPVHPGAYDTAHNGQKDAFVLRMDGTGTIVKACTFLGGFGDDDGRTIVSDNSGLVTVTGKTYSSDFPTQATAYDTSYNGEGDAFLAQLSADLSQLLYSSFLGGMGEDWGNELSVGADGVITLAGGSFSSDFPTTFSSYDTTHNGDADLVLLRLDPQQTGPAQLQWSTFLGGVNMDAIVNGLSVDDAGVVTLAGETCSPDFPTSPGAFDPLGDACRKAFAARLNPSLAPDQQLIYATYLGGSGDQNANGVGVDGSGRIVVSGATSSTDFPTTPGVLDTTHNGSVDVYVALLDPRLSGSAQLVASTLLGGPGDEVTNDLVLRSGTVTIVGASGLSAGLPTTAGTHDPSLGGAVDGFVARLDPGLTELQYATYLGGSDVDALLSVVVDETGGTTAGGFTTSLDYPSTAGAFDTSWNGGSDVALTRIDLLPTGAVPYGTSTPGCAGPVGIAVDSMPQESSLDFALLGLNAPPDGVGILGISKAKLIPPATLLGADLWIDPTPGQLLLTLTASSDHQGYSEVVVPIPPGTSGAMVHAQFLWLPNTCGPEGISTSGALELTIQP